VTLANAAGQTGLPGYKNWQQLKKWGEIEKKGEGWGNSSYWAKRKANKGKKSLGEGES